MSKNRVKIDIGDDIFGKEKAYDDGLSDELREKGYAIFRREGTYLTFLRWKRRKAITKMQAMFKDLFDRYGQKLDGDANSKVLVGDNADARTR